MKSRSPLVMLEQLLMLLIFALAAALCLQAFTLADSQSKTSSARDSAILEVQQVAETVKYCHGDMDEAAKMLDARWDGEVLSLDGESSTIYAKTVDSGHALLGSAELWAEAKSGDILFSLSVAWQTGGAK